MGHPVQIGVKILNICQLVPAASELQENIVNAVFRYFGGCRHPQQIGIQFGAIMIEKFPESSCITHCNAGEQLMLIVWLIGRQNPFYRCKYLQIIAKFPIFPNTRTRHFLLTCIAILGLDTFYSAP